MYIKHTLQNINLDSFGFVEREVISGEKLTNQCGRDFFYYVLTYFYPEKHNRHIGNPRQISESEVFEWSWLPVGLIWTGLTFKKVPKYLRSLGLRLYINKKEVNGYFTFLLGMWPLRPLAFEKGIQEIENAINENSAVGVDISMALGGLADHVMFVYGYDEDNLYVFDTHQAGKLEYEKMTPSGDQRFIMKLPKTIVKKRWTIFNRVWVVKKI